MNRWLAMGFALCTFAGAPGQAWAHARSTSFSYWDETPGALHGQVVFPWLELQQAFPEWRNQSAEEILAHAGNAEAIADFFRRRLAFVPATSCGQPTWSRPRALDATVRFALDATCSAPLQAIRFDLTFDFAPSHVHLVRFEREGAVLSGVVTSVTREWIVAPDPGEQTGSSFASFVRSGFEHILAGPDHLVFLLALLLLSTSLTGLAWLATGFTLAHSLSLAVAVFGLTRPHAPTVEALIGFTVLFSGLEVLLAVSRPEEHRWRRWVRGGFALAGVTAVAAAGQGWLHIHTVALAGVVLFSACFLYLADERPAWRWLLVFLFGFVHGFGFAGPLLDLALDRADTAKALLGFNLGVEAGQIAFLAVLWPAVALASKRFARTRVAAVLGAVALAAGLQWFLVRGM